MLVTTPAGEERIRRLRISVEAGFGRLHLQVGRVRSHRGPADPFFDRVAEQIEGCTISAIERLPSDRIVRIDFVGEGKGGSLVLELFGRHPALYLLDSAGKAMARLGSGAREEATERTPLGSPYLPPPPSPTPSGRETALIEAFGPGPSEAPPLAGQAPLSWAVESSLGSSALESRQATERRSLGKRLRRRAKLARSQAVKLQERLRACQECERVRQDGELLKANFHALARGQGSVTLIDYFDPRSPERTLTLDPKLGPSENVKRYFARAKRLEKEALRLPHELEQAQELAGAVEALLQELDRPQSEPQELEQRAIERGWLKPKQDAGRRKRPSKPKPRLPYRTFHTARGAQIRVGRSARDNDQLSLKESRGNDLWLHTADAPGSHVVLRTEKGVEPDPEDVLDAAHLAVHFSPLRGARRADVHVALCKQVHKPKGAPPGLVHLRGGRNLAVRMEPERLQALLDTRPGSSKEDT